jgi:hypothetical protein
MRETNDRRSVREIRGSLEHTRQQMDADLTVLGHRLEDSLNPVNIARRHPLVVAAAGAVFGFLLVRKPAMLLRAAVRLAGLGAPLLLSAILRPDGGSVGTGPEEE